MPCFFAQASYLGGLEITFRGGLEGENSPREQLEAVSGLLREIEAEMRANITEFEGTHDFK